MGAIKGGLLRPSVKSVQSAAKKSASLREMWGLGPRFNPASSFLVKDFDGFVRNHLTRAAYGTVDGPHGTGSYRFPDKFNPQPRVTSLAYAWEQHVTFQLNLPGVILAHFKKNKRSINDFNVSLRGGGYEGFF